MEGKLNQWKFFIHTFGCQMNENDSERLAGLLIKEGAQKTYSAEKSNLIIVNTCAVREKSVEKFYSYLGRLAALKKKKKELVICVAGCVAQLYKSKLLEKRNFIDLIIGIDNYYRLPEFLAALLPEKIVAMARKSSWQEIAPEFITRENKITAYVTIMEGCNHFCSYCVVPFARGREKFRLKKYILAEIHKLATTGYKEIQLLGQNVNAYVDPETGENFASLLQDADQIEGIKWIRFFTSHPKNLSEEIVLTMKNSRKICRALHIPIQSGSTSILKAMNRGYTKEEYLEKIALLRLHIPDIALSTDIIVGFPGETERDFQETLGVLEKIRFINIFSFRYSPRPFSAAARRKDDVPEEEKIRRLMEVQRLQKSIQLEINAQSLGQTLRVLCLGRSKKDHSQFSGRDEAHRLVNFSAPREVSGEFVNIKITSCGPYSLHGEYTNSGV